MITIISDLLFFSLIYSISMAQWRNPKLFMIEGLASRLDKQAKVKRTETFDVSTRQNLFKNILKHMEVRQPYLNNGLSLDSLANSIGMSSHHLSEVINKEAGKNFYQFVNEYRVNYACKRISTEPNIKIIELSSEAGFSSKSTFNAVFKQITNTTPSQYRKMQHDA